MLSVLEKKPLCLHNDEARKDAEKGRLCLPLKKKKKRTYEGPHFSCCLNSSKLIHIICLFCFVFFLHPMHFLDTRFAFTQPSTK